jgi:hypothetical protein
MNLDLLEWVSKEKKDFDVDGGIRINQLLKVLMGLKSFTW